MAQCGELLVVLSQTSELAAGRCRLNQSTRVLCVMQEEGLVDADARPKPLNSL